MSTAAPPAISPVAAYASGTAADHFADWCATRCIQSVDEFAGVPLVFEPWQLDFFEEALAVDEDERWYWRSVVKVVPRKNGKTHELAAYALYRCDQDEGSPEVLLTASSDEQAGRLFDAAQSFIRKGAYLGERFHLRDYVGEIARSDGGGLIERMASNPRRGHGYSPSLVVADELHAWTTRSLRKFWATMKTGGGARSAAQVFAITVAGAADERDTEILGQLIDGAAAAGEVEQRGTLTIIRHHAARLLVWIYEGPPECDPRPLRQARAAHRHAQREHGEDSTEARDALAVAEEWRVTVGTSAKAANPASWITADYLADQAEDPEIEPAEFLQLHCGVWATQWGTFIPREIWMYGATGKVPEPGAFVSIAVDGSRNHDCTVVGIAQLQPDGRVRVGAHIFAALDWMPHHELHDRKISYERVEEYIVADCFGRFRVTKAGFDPRYLLRSTEILEKRLPGASLIEIEPQSGTMRDAYARLHRMAYDQMIDHDGDPAVTAHFSACRGQKTEAGWTIKKTSSTESAKPIDAVPAIAMAVELALMPISVPLVRTGRAR